MTEDDTGKRFDLDVEQRILLDPGEAADLVLGKPDVVKVGRIHPGQAALDFPVRQPEVIPLPVVETG